MVIKHLGVNTLRGRLGDEKISDEGGYLHVKDRTEAWRRYFEEVDRMRAGRHVTSPPEEMIPEGMEGNYFL